MICSYVISDSGVAEKYDPQKSFSKLNFTELLSITYQVFKMC